MRYNTVVAVGVIVSIAEIGANVMGAVAAGLLVSLPTTGAGVDASGEAVLTIGAGVKTVTGDFDSAAIGAGVMGCSVVVTGAMVWNKVEGTRVWSGNGTVDGFLVVGARVGVWVGIRVETRVSVGVWVETRDETRLIVGV